MFTYTVIIFQFLVLYQVISPKEISNVNYNSKSSLLEDVIIRNDMNGLLTPYSAQKLLINDLWKGAKQSAINAWNAVKRLVNNSKEKVKLWTDNVKSQAIRSSKIVEERLKILKININQIIQNILGGENWKKCLKKGAENIDIFMRKIAKQVTKCISDKLGSLKKLEDDMKYLNDDDDTDFISNVETKLNGCLLNGENHEECFENVRTEILKEADAMENKTLNERELTRRKIDEILEAIVNCSTEGLINVSAAITQELVEIVKCVIKG